MYGKRGFKKGKANKTIKKAMWKATKTEDKLQNKAIMSLQKQIKQLKGNEEIKFFDNTLNAQVAYLGTSLIQPLSYLAQGTDLNNRIADQITPLHFHTKLTLYVGMTGNVPSLPYSSIMRIIFFQYLEDESVVGLTITDLLNTATVNSNRNPYKLQSFKVLYDRCHVLDTNYPIREVNIRKALSRKIKYDGAAYNNTTYNQLYMYIISNDDSLSSNGNPSTIDFDSRLTFRDD